MATHLLSAHGQRRRFQSSRAFAMQLIRLPTGGRHCTQEANETAAQIKGFYVSARSHSCVHQTSCWIVASPPGPRILFRLHSPISIASYSFSVAENRVAAK